MAVCVWGVGMEWNGTTHQSTGEANHGKRCAPRLSNVKQVVEKHLILVMSEEVKIVQYDDHTLLAVITCKRDKNKIDGRHL